jgi:hypothetical protein
MRKSEFDVIKCYYLNQVLKIIDKHLVNIDATKFNHLMLADNSDFHRTRYLIEDGKEDLLEEIKKEVYNLK